MIDTSGTPAANRTTVSNRIDFSASLDSFQGPLDLLLYLIKENEVEITAISISTILEQYLRFLDQATQWDLQLAGEFLVVAATLMEIKSRELLPAEAQAADEELIEDPRSELVRQLLQYRQLKDQAKVLEDLQNKWREHRPRGLFNDIPEILPDAAEANASDRATAREALLDVDLYTLFSAYERILKAVLGQAPRDIVYDGESIEAKITRIEAALKSNPFMRFAELITQPNNRADVAATFVALLELVRRRAVRLIQSQEYGDIGVKTRTQEENESDAAGREEADASEAAAEAALRSKAEQDAEGGQDGAQKLPWTQRRGAAKPKFEGILRPEDVEEIDAEENEIGRRIDAILAAAEVICERFEQSREGRQRADEAQAVMPVAAVPALVPVPVDLPPAPPQT